MRSSPATGLASPAVLKTTHGRSSVAQVSNLGCRLLAGAVGALAAFAWPAGAERSAPRDSGGRGTIVHYEESRAPNIVYLEEKSGMISTANAPVAVERDGVAAPKSPAAEPKIGRAHV